jgi:tetratricopeptide (TPR) repeat protein
MAQLRIFVSHSSADTDICVGLVEALRGAGADVWYDQDDLGPGQLLDVIQHELQTRRIFIVILSQAAFASQWVLRECMWAYNLRERDPVRIILPISITPITPHDFDGRWLFFENFNRLELPQGQPFPPDQAIAETLRVLALTPESKPSLPDTAASLVAGQETVLERSGSMVSAFGSIQPAALLTYGEALLAQRQYAMARPWFEVAQQVAPDDVSVWIGLLQVYIGLGQFDEALQVGAHFLTCFPTNVLAWIQQGTVALACKRSAIALESFERALTLESHLADAWEGKGAALEALGRYDEALDATEHARALDQMLKSACLDHTRILLAGTGTSVGCLAGL